MLQTLWTKEGEGLKNNPELQVLPADSIICLHEQIFGQKNYDKEIEAFKSFAKVAEISENE